MVQKKMFSDKKIIRDPNNINSRANKFSLWLETAIIHT